MMGDDLLASMEWLLIGSSIFSAIMSLYVVTTSLVFGDMGKRPFMCIIFWISLCDCLGSAFAALGFPPNSSLVCPIQSFFLNMFFKASWLWIVILCYQMNFFLKYGRFGMGKVPMHFIVWTLSIGITLLPLAEVEFGRDDDPAGWCFLANGRASYQVEFYWGLATFNIFLIVCVAAMIVYCMLLYFRFQNMSPNIKENVVHIVQGFYLYPVGMVIVWLPTCLISALANASVLQSGSQFNPTLAFGLLSAINTQNGTVTALIFMMLSKESWIRWHRLFMYVCYNEVVNQNNMNDTSWKEIIRRYEDETDVSNDVFSETSSVYTVDTATLERKATIHGHDSVESSLFDPFGTRRTGYGKSTEMTVSQASQSSDAMRLNRENKMMASSWSHGNNRSDSSAISSLFSVQSSSSSRVHGKHFQRNANHSTASNNSPSLSTGSATSSTVLSPLSRQQQLQQYQQQYMSQQHHEARQHMLQQQIPSNVTSSPNSVRPNKPKPLASTAQSHSDDSNDLSTPVDNVDNDVAHNAAGMDEENFIGKLDDLSTPEYFEASQLSSSFVHELPAQPASHAADSSV
jgi:hypothetical protein